MTVSVFVSALLFTAAALALHEYTRQHNSLEAMREKISGVVTVTVFYNGPSVGPSMRADSDEPVALLPAPSPEFELDPDWVEDLNQTFRSHTASSISRSMDDLIEDEGIEFEDDPVFTRRDATEDMAEDPRLARGFRKDEFAAEHRPGGMFH